MQLIELEGVTAAKKIKTGGYESKPLSADAIHKQKFKEMILSTDQKVIDITPLATTDEDASAAGLRKGSIKPRSPMVLSSSVTTSSSLTITSTPPTTPPMTDITMDDATDLPVVERVIDERRKRSSKKNPKVTWSTELVNVRTFVVETGDDYEGEQKRPTNFGIAALNERQRERDAVLHMKGMSILCF
jgi:hypothetical protein